ncbi:hypothetical protein AGMMS49965_26100 [Bacteroidia bacterium]|nr:hypothetical protein AGMMS49965_26100 [Bacteroidia bacterium]
MLKNLVGMLKELNLAYDILHLSGYYDGIQDARVVQAGFEHAYKILEHIKPDHVLEVPLPSTKPAFLKTLYSIFV